MISIHFSFYTKNHALLIETTVESEYVPRIGEMINMNSSKEIFNFELEDYDFIIYDVFHELIDSKLVANVECHQHCNPDLRRILLEEHGWA